MKRIVYFILFSGLCIFFTTCSDSDTVRSVERNYLDGNVYELDAGNANELLAVQKLKFIMLHEDSCGSCPQTLQSFRSYALQKAGRAVFASLDMRRQSNFLNVQAAGRLPAIVVYDGSGLEIGSIASLGTNEASLARAVELFMRANALAF
ncbi:MAG: hypothetical protein MI784_08180 [Cytophagales bacterium]|nr:hypothetical protein [Cytophagales bacterium]